MADEGLVRYIRERLGEGYKEDYIRDVLETHGHGQKEVDEAFRSIHRSNGKLPIIPILIILVLIAAGIFLFLKLQAPVEREPPPPVLPNTSIERQPAKNVMELAEELKAKNANLSADQVYFETVKAANENAVTVADGALLCSANRDTQYKNYCFQELGASKKEPAYCDLIGVIKERDACYLKIILTGEDQYCARLVLEESKRTCALLNR